MADPSSLATRTAGEELYLVHLRRWGDNKMDDDIDQGIGSQPFAGPKRNAHPSVGEELWEIHVKRSRGRMDDEDDDNSNRNSKNNDEEVAVKNPTGSPCRYNLRYPRRQEPTVMSSRNS